MQGFTRMAACLLSPDSATIQKAPNRGFQE